MMEGQDQGLGISVSLSGGGHRAALFGLGALLYLADAGKNSAVTSIASVSGGSLTNGHLAQSIPYQAASAAEVDEWARVAKRFATQGTLFAAAITWIYLIFLGAVVLALGALNEQWLERWCALNGWGRVELSFRAQLWSTNDWRELRADLLAGRATIADANAAFEIEREEIKRHERNR